MARIGYKTIEDIILPILKAEPTTRDNDATLYCAYLRYACPSALGMRFEDVLTYRERLGIASIETVGRCRRRLQNKHADIRASARAEDDRYAKWKETRDYATN